MAFVLYTQRHIRQQPLACNHMQMCLPPTSAPHTHTYTPTHRLISLVLVCLLAGAFFLLLGLWDHQHSHWAPVSFLFKPPHHLHCNADRVGDGIRGGWGREEVCGETVLGVKYVLADLLCHSGRSSVGWGEGRNERESFEGYPPACIHDSDIRYQSLELNGGRRTK